MASYEDAWLRENDQTPSSELGSNFFFTVLIDLHLQIQLQVQLFLNQVLELELIQSHMAQKPMLRGEVGARALRVRSDVRGHGQVRLCKALGCGRCGCLKPIKACCVVGSALFLVAPPRGGCAMAPRDSGMC